MEYEQKIYQLETEKDQLSVKLEEAQAKSEELTLKLAKAESEELTSSLNFQNAN